MLRARSWTHALRKRVALGSATLLLLGGVLLVEHEANEHHGGEPACVVCLSSGMEGLGHAAVALQRVTIAATSAPCAEAQAASGGVQLQRAIRAPPNSANA